MTSGAPSRDGAPDTSGSMRRNPGSRDRLLAAAMGTFCERGYLATSVEDIAAAAGVSRMTFYRHFRNRADVAAELFRVAAAESTPRYLAITSVDHTDRDAVLVWIQALFAADRADRLLLQVFTQARSDPDGFTERAQQLMGDLIRELGRSIPAFALDPDEPTQRRRWIEAWLLLYEILDQSNHAALNSGVAVDDLVPDILAERFLRFVTAPSS
ncbi:TetR/AcrR family transcriptional regulator [Trujillonella endophytica]|uniref:Transcriptional regulator, TetR family n=1 Tax=Trujillonella endophytica TaxID=673521 RepID=A0A1H8Q318_9ACTN|nr:TetR/AcrR family transcriptional regulator [Trujillella endophytica]SEO48645.1 transcriptional regulator, TetR family [Trujillella endophytica]